MFDSSREDDAVFTFEVGKGKVIRAWELGVKSMKVGAGEAAGKGGVGAGMITIGHRVDWFSLDALGC